MHSYLVVGSDESEIEKVVKQKVHDLGKIRLDYSLAKIEDARNLASLIKLKNEGVFVIRNIDRATVEALNAFLKNLEDPGENIIFVLSASNLQRVLPTVISRSQVIYTKSDHHDLANTKQINEFFRSKTSERILFVWKLKGREEALEFITSVIVFVHNRLDKSKDPVYAAKIIDEADRTRRAIESYGVYKLHLLRFIVSIDK